MRVTRAPFAVAHEDAVEKPFRPEQMFEEPLQFHRGDPEGALASAEVRVDQTYVSPNEHPCAMEMHGCVASWSGGTLTVYNATQWVMGDLEKVGLLKMDFLGLRTLTLLDNALKLIQKTRGITIDLQKLPLDDAETYDLLQKGDIIVEIAGQTIANIYDYTYALDVLKIGEPAKVVYMRNGQRRETTMTPAARK